MSFAQHQQRLYRVTYEAYSKFANDINRCADLLEVSEVCKTHLKYLLNYRVIRMVVERNNKYVFFEICGNTIDYDFNNKMGLFSYEKTLLDNSIPLCTPDIPDLLLRNKPGLENLVDPILWAWNFDKYDKKVIVTLVADKERAFSTGDIEILKLVVDSLQTKFNEIYLKRELAIRNENLSEAYDTIKKQNDEIQYIVDHQKEIIKEGIREIEEKNKKLLHISALNAHNVREPLSRILGIIQLFDLMDDETCRKELVPKLENSAKEMDRVLKEVVDMASKELVKLKAKDQ